MNQTNLSILSSLPDEEKNDNSKEETSNIEKEKKRNVRSFNK